MHVRPSHLPLGKTNTAATLRWEPPKPCVFCLMKTSVQTVTACSQHNITGCGLNIFSIGG